MNEKSGQEKDFSNLINLMTNHSEIRDKYIFELDEIIDRIKQNRSPSVEDKEESLIGPSSPDVVCQFRTSIQRMNMANDRLRMIINRLNELV